MSRRARKLWRWWPLGLIALGGGGLALWGQREGGSEPIDAALVVSARRGTLAIEILETGRVEPRERVELKSKVAGQVAEVLVEEGARVTRSELLLVIDPTDYQREVARAEAEIAQATAATDFARQKLDRTKRAIAEKVLAGEEMDAAEHQLRSGMAGLLMARVALSAAQDRVRYTRMLSPIDGTVIQRAIEVGEVVVPGVQSTFEGTPLLTIADLATLLVKVDLNQIDVAKVQLGASASVSLDALPGKKFAAKVTRIAAASVKPAGKEAELFPVEVELVSSDPAIKPGMSADVTIHLEERQNVLSLPIESVVREGNKSLVTRVASLPNGKERTEKIEVTLGIRNDRELEVLSGLSEGDRVLINPGSAAANETAL
jgi:HlyD family secretion protein/macrolide-specific efflux system membrane fusion protein